MEYVISNEVQPKPKWKLSRSRYFFYMIGTVIACNVGSYVVAYACGFMIGRYGHFELWSNDDFAMVNNIVGILAITIAVIAMMKIAAARARDADVSTFWWPIAIFLPVCWIILGCLKPIE
jgi:uncharacterized membrane protein YhaH (DUF805 family)